MRYKKMKMISVSEFQLTVPLLMLLFKVDTSTAVDVKQKDSESYGRCTEFRISGVGTTSLSLYGSHVQGRGHY